MALLTMPSDYVVGTISLINGSVDFTGAGTAWQLVGLKEGDLLIDVDGATQFWAIIDEITSNVAGKLTRPWAGPDLTDAHYRMRFTSDGVRSTAQAAMLRQELGNGRVQAIATATGTSGVLEYLPGGGAQLVPKTDLINGVAVDKRVNTMDDRAAYDTQADQFSVYVADVGDAFGVENAGRAATFFRDGDTAGVWSDPAYVTGETGDKGDRGDEGPTGPGFKFIEGGYDSGTAYVVGDVVRDNGSSWIALQATTGNAPPVYPVAANDWWELVAAAGKDGTGTGDMVGPASATDGAPALFDGNTGKLTKVGAFATQGEAEAGAQNTTFMTPLRTAQAILALSPPTDMSDLETTVSQVALQLADVSNQALFLGPTGNRVADSFDTLTYVDVAGATNLDTSTPGILKPTSSPAVLIPQATGTAIFSGFSVRTSTLFDGITNQVETAAAQTGSSGTSALVGKDYSAAPKAVSSARVYGTSDNGYTSGSGNSTSFKLRGKNGAAPSGPTDGTLLGQVLSVPDTNTTNMQTIPSSDTDTVRDYLWVEFLNSASAFMLAAEVEFYTPPVVNNLTVRSASFSAAAAPTKMKALLRVKEVSAAVAGTDYTLECSRDAGTTWTSMPLSEMFATGGLRYVETAEVDVSGQPAGTSPRWRWKTLNNKNVELHDAYIYWS